MTPINPLVENDEQIVAYLDQQIATLKQRIEATERIVTFCQQGYGVLREAPAPTLANVGEVVGALNKALECLIRANLEANVTSLHEIHEQLAKVETARHQRASKVHLGGFVPRVRT